MNIYLVYLDYILYYLNNIIVTTSISCISHAYHPTSLLVYFSINYYQRINFTMLNDFLLIFKSGYLYQKREIGKTN